MSNLYSSPLCTKYSSKEMLELFSANMKYQTWRELWTELAKVQKTAGLEITDQQIADLSKYISKIDFDEVEKQEKITHHEVMAHILAYGKQASSAKGIIHLGCTSSFVMDNGDLISMKRGLKLLSVKLKTLIIELAGFVGDNKSIACTGYTHLQPAQPTTVGKRASLWLQDLVNDFTSLKHFEAKLPFLGLKGAVGSQFSYYELFDRDLEKLRKAEEQLAQAFGFDHIIPLSSQTYTRKIDVELLNLFSSFAASVCKMANDLRLLAHLGEVYEAFDKNQVGSSAMPHKKNPIYCERICSLSRLLMTLSQNPLHTAANQWLERSLDDSANRRITLVESFLLFDALIDLSCKVIKGLVVDQEKISQNLNENLPKLLLEPILTLCVQKGLDRQQVHERLKNYVNDSKDCFLEAIKSDSLINVSETEILAISNPNYLSGLCQNQVEEYLQTDLVAALQTNR